jgi:hypothetical protein
MSIGRFLFGAGWWIPGQKPDPASPGGMIVFLIALTLGGLTLVNALLLEPVLVARWYLKAGVALGLTTAVLAVGLPLNSHLALAQSRAALYANLAYVAVGVAGNLVLMWLARTRPHGSLTLFGG